MVVDLTQYLAFLLILLRMIGLLVFHPILGRNNIPTQLNIGFSFVLAILLMNTVAVPEIPDPSLFTFFYMALKEMAVGMVAGFITQMFLSVIIMGGEIMDTQMGISMSKVFDPGSNASISLSSSMFNVMFVVVFFVTNNHLTLIYMASQTFEIIPLGMTGFNLQVLEYIPTYFATILIFAVKLCMPIVVIEIVVTMAVGIIMRIIPQINIFVVNIQFKLLVGFFVLVILVAPLTAFIENMIIICTETIQEVWSSFI